MTAKLFSDQPIGSKIEDRLGRVAFAERVAESILGRGPGDSFCIALFGPWGSGKTSIINLCLGHIEARTKDLPPERRPIVLRFQPWLISGQEQLIGAFLSQLRKSLGKPGLSEQARKAAQHLEKYERLFEVVAWIPPASGIAGKARAVLARLRDVMQDLSKSSEKDLEGQKETVCAELRKLQSKIVVVIDDIDRLTSDEIRQVFQLIKAVADFPNTLYLLAFEPECVEKALEPFQAGTDVRYLEKVVQLSFEVPSPSQSQITAILLEGLEDVVQSIPTEKNEQHRWKQIRFGPLAKLFRNLRDVKRFLNAVTFKFPPLRDEVNATDVLILEAIFQFAPAIYKVIRNNKELLTSDSPLARMDARREERTQWINDLSKLMPDRHRDEIKELLFLLFPEVESIYKRHGWGSGMGVLWQKARRICLSNYFGFYFQGALPEGAVSAKEVNRVIDTMGNQEELASLLRGYMEDKRITELLPQLENSLGDPLDPEKIRNLAAATFEAGEKLSLQDSFFDTPLDWVVDGTIYRLVKRLDRGCRKRVLVEAIAAASKGAYFPVSMAYFVWREWNAPKEKGTRSDEEKLLAKEESDEVKAAALALIRERKDTDSLYKTRRLGGLIRDWEEWAGLEEVKEWVAIILQDDQKIPHLLVGFGGYASSAQVDAHYSQSRFKIDAKFLGKYCDLASLKEKCQRLLTARPEWLPEEQVPILEIFQTSCADKQNDD